MTGERRITVVAVGESIRAEVADRIDRLSGSKCTLQSCDEITGKTVAGADLVIVCVNAPDGPGSRQLDGALEDVIEQPVLVVLDDLGDGEKVAGWFRRGVQGCMFSRAAEGILERAVEEVLAGRRFMCPSIRDMLAAKYVLELQAPALDGQGSGL